MFVHPVLFRISRIITLILSYMVDDPNWLLPGFSASILCSQSFMPLGVIITSNINVINDRHLRSNVSSLKYLKSTN